MRMGSTAINVPEPDQPKAIAAAICMAVIGISFFLGMPVIVAAWSEQMGFGDQQAGWLASADISGITVASLLISRIINTVSRQQLAVIGLLVAILANLVAIGIDTFKPLLATRFFAGLGGGVLFSLGLAALAATNNAGRNYATLMFSQVSIGVVVINLYPSLADFAGMIGIYLSMCVAFVAAAFFIPWLPAFVEEPDCPALDQSGAYPPLLPWLCLLAFFAFYLTIGSFWAYIERIGSSAGLEDSFITGALSYTQVISLPVCVLAGWLCGRVGQLRPLIVSLAIGGSAVYLLSVAVNEFTYVAVLVIFFMVWNPIDIYQLGTLSNIDHSGRYVAMVPAFQGAANSLGPAGGAFLLEINNSFDLLLMVGSAMMFIAVAIYLYLYAMLRPASTSTGASF